MITNKMILLAAVIVNNLSNSHTITSVALVTEFGVNTVLLIKTKNIAKRYEWDKHTESFMFRCNSPIEV